MQRFLIIGNKGYRDAMDAVKDKEFVPGQAVFAEFETTARVNDFYEVHAFKVEADGKSVTPTGRAFARTIDDIFEQYSNGSLIGIKKINVFPYLEPKKPDRSKN